MKIIIKRVLPPVGVIAALGAIAVVAAVVLGAGSDGTKGSARQSDDTSKGPGIAAMCLEGATDCDDMVVEGEDVIGACLEGAADCVDTGTSASRCITEDGVTSDVPVPECNDMIDCTADDADCPQVGDDPRVDPGVPYQVIITFDASVTQANLAEVTEVLSEIAPDTEFLVRESFPPVGVARIMTGMDSFCADIEARFESLTYVSDVTCDTAGAAPVQPSDPDEPVSSEPDAGQEDGAFQ